MSLTNAIILATKAHAGQYRKDPVTWEYTREPYILHPIRVMLGVTDDLKPAAVLHDMVEDSDHTIADVRLYCGDRTADLVRLLTKPTDTAYLDYIRRIRQIAEASTIKRVDIYDNLVGLPAGSRRKRYLKALEILKL